MTQDLLNQAFAQTTVRIDPNRINSQRPPDPPPDPPPNRSKPGGGLNPAARSSCTQDNHYMQALVPIKNPVLTTTDQPTIFFYIPFESNQVEFGEFSLLPWPQEQQRIYTVRFTLPKTPGIVSVTIPSQPERVFEKSSLIGLSRPGLEIGANRKKSTEGTEPQSSRNFQSVSTDFAPLDRDFQSRAGQQRSAATFDTFQTSSELPLKQGEYYQWYFQLYC
jgi:hypothetical protein